ncbi:MAG: hypothetical protein WBR31_10055, partial [Candidatus Sulfotelmatobacter sp.]
MLRKFRNLILAAAIFAATIFAATIFAATIFASTIFVGTIFVGTIFAPKLANAQAVSLQEQLAAQYKLVKMGSDTSGYSVVEEGTLLAIQKGG